MENPGNALVESFVHDATKTVKNDSRKSLSKNLLKDARTDESEIVLEDFPQLVHKELSPDVNEGSSCISPEANKEEISDLKKPSASCLCKCAFFRGKPCKNRYSDEDLQNIRKQYSHLEHKDLDLVILSKLQYGMHLSRNIVRSRKNAPVERKQQSTDYYYHGQSICREMFKYMHNISQNRLSALIKHYKTHGLKARVHGNCNRVQAHAFTSDDVTRVVNFITNYAETHGRSSSVRSKKPSGKRLILNNCTKKQVYDEYVSASGDQRKVSLSKFRSMWKKLVPGVRIAPPSTPTTATVATSEVKQHSAVKAESRPPHCEPICNQYYQAIPAQFQTSLNQAPLASHQLHHPTSNQLPLNHSNPHLLQSSHTQLHTMPNQFEAVSNPPYPMTSFGRV